MPAVDRVDLGPSIDSGHVTILCQVMAGSRALETMYNHSSVMYNPAPVGEMFRVTGDLVSNDGAGHFINMFARQELPGESKKTHI